VAIIAGQSRISCSGQRTGNDYELVHPSGKGGAILIDAAETQRGNVSIWISFDARIEEVPDGPTTLK
jgi:hypothetical protein